MQNGRFHLRHTGSLHRSEIFSIKPSSVTGPGNHSWMQTFEPKNTSRGLITGEKISAAMNLSLLPCNQMTSNLLFSAKIPLLMSWILFSCICNRLSFFIPVKVFSHKLSRLFMHSDKYSTLGRSAKVSPGISSISLYGRSSAVKFSMPAKLPLSIRFRNELWTM